MVLLGPLMPKHGHVVRRDLDFGRMALWQGEGLFKMNVGRLGFKNWDVMVVLEEIYGKFSNSEIGEPVSQMYLRKFQHRKMKQDREWSNW